MADSAARGCSCGQEYPCDACSGGTRAAASNPEADRTILLAAARILRRESERDTSRSKNDQAELRIAAAVCEGMTTRV